MKSHIHLLILCLTLSFNSVAQIRSRNSPNDFGFSTFTIKGSKDRISFIVSDTSLKIKKPVFIFCQGSLPYALFYKEDSIHTWQQAIPFNFKKYWKDFYFVVISKPGIPVFTHTADSNYFYTDPISKTIPSKYLLNNNLMYRVTTVNDVINYLVKQKWADKSKIIIAGHSEGSKVAAIVGASNKNITHVIFLSGNPYSRFDQGIREIKRDELLGKKTAEQAQKEIDELNLQVIYWYQHPDEFALRGSKEKYSNYTSFYEPMLPYLLKIKSPLFVAFGTNDIISENCNLLPFEFARKGKTNLTIKSYLDCDHGFKKNKYDTSGKIISSEEMFDSVADDFFNWLKTAK